MKVYFSHNNLVLISGPLVILGSHSNSVGTLFLFHIQQKREGGKAWARHGLLGRWSLLPTLLPFLF